jgi:multidrug resistance efflux pump
VGVCSLLVHRLRAAPPTIEQPTVWVDEIKRGVMVRQVQGQGTLTAEQVRWITAIASARVEEIIVRPGAHVEPDTVLVRLGNPDLELRALEADRQVAAAEADLVNLRATLRSQRLGQESVVAGLRSDLAEAKRRAAADDELAGKGFLSSLEMAQSREREGATAARVEFETKRLQAQSQGDDARLTAQRAQVERLRSIAEFRHREVRALQVSAGVAAVVQELPLQVGQWVSPGALLAKVAQPDKLKAEVRIPETQARDVQVGLPATIDTHNGVVQGKVTRVDPAAHGGTVTVDVALEGPLPRGARPDLNIEGTIELERLENTAYMGRPVFAQPQGTISLFRLNGDGTEATRVTVRLGRSSAKTVEVLDGLRPGDRVILSDLSALGAVDRIRLR